MASSGGTWPPAYGAHYHVPDAIGQTRSAALYLFDQNSNVWEPIINAGTLTDVDTALDTPPSAPWLYNGGTWDRQRTPKIFKTISTVAVGAEVTIWTPAAGKKFRLMGFALALSAATTLTIKDNTAGATIFRLLLGAGGPGQTVYLGNGILSAAANNVLTATSGAAANLDGTVWGTEE